MRPVVPHSSPAVGAIEPLQREEASRRPAGGSITAEPRPGSSPASSPASVQPLQDMPLQQEGGERPMSNAEATPPLQPLLPAGNVQVLVAAPADPKAAGAPVPVEIAPARPPPAPPPQQSITVNATTAEDGRASVSIAPVQGSAERHVTVEAAAAATIAHQAAALSGASISVAPEGAQKGTASSNSTTASVVDVQMQLPPVMCLVSKRGFSRCHMGRVRWGCSWKFLIYMGLLKALLRDSV